MQDHLKNKINEELNINKESAADGKLSGINYDIKKTDNNLPEVIDTYEKILERRKQRQSASGNSGATIICILMFLSVFYNIYIVENEKYEQNILKIQQEQTARQQQAELDKVKLQIVEKNKESADLVIFNDKYSLIRTDFYNNIKAISVKADNKVNSLGDIIKITEDRIKLTEDYKSKLNMLAFPSQLTDFYKYEIEFADSDINLWKIVNSYYALNDLSKFDTNKVYEESSKSHGLFLKAQEELKNIYTKYELSYFLKDIIINY
ncbi:MAG: hypothetical protein ACYCZ1_07275 [Candidatus Humimicrobiaceae bacterium]